ncbi:MAG TPA: SLAC1 anion channel family protein [Nocardioides sp.]|uniref:SLAC1 anion channel family protein n=1 Tax=Nocardioides sp. TaxID=35761 RepID=UPI002CE3771A|nr:SLAC1 anion channel family protein [Nocardioides sp.]HQR26002.1 SLAC1 anion channel family protein [Nocardioides sp.]
MSTGAPATSTMPTTTSLAHLPVTLFAAVMGLGGLALAWRRAALVWDLPHWPADLLFWVAVAVFVLLASAYLAKWVRYPEQARAELRHPIRMTFVPTVTIGLLVLATAGQDLVPTLAQGAWWVGAVGHLVLTLVVISAWFTREDIGLTEMTPAWFIPVVGNVVTPLAARSLGSVELAWFAFGVGLVFWVALLPLLLFRLLLHGSPLPPPLLPTLAIFVAPPAVIGLSWVALGGHPGDPVTRIFYAAMVAFLLLVLAQGRRLARVPFALPWWAYTFPLGAAAAAATAAAGAWPGTAYDVVAGTLLILATVVVAVVVALTLRLAVRHQICVPD